MRIILPIATKQMGVFFILSSDVWEKSHKPCMLDRSCELALIFGCNTSSLFSHDLCIRRQEFVEQFDVLVINMLDIILLEVTLFLHSV